MTHQISIIAFATVLALTLWPLFAGEPGPPFGPGPRLPGGVKELEGDVGGNLDCSSRLQAACDYFGPTDFLQMDAQAPAGAKLKHNPAWSPESKLIGGPIQENKQQVAKANPITYVTKDAAPFLIVHGDAHDTVPWGQSKVLHEALQKAGANSTFLTVPGAGHGQIPAREYNPKVLAFSNQYLKAAQ